MRTHLDGEMLTSTTRRQLSGQTATACFSGIQYSTKSLHLGIQSIKSTHRSSCAVLMSKHVSNHVRCIQQAFHPSHPTRTLTAHQIYHSSTSSFHFGSSRHNCNTSLISYTKRIINARHQSNFNLRYLSSATPSNKDKDSDNKLLDGSNILPIKLQTHRDKPPPISKVLSILLPEYKWLTLAVGALTISTAATMQFPNAIGSMIDILNGVDITAVKESIEAVQTIDGENPVMAVDKQKVQMKSIAVEMMGYFTVGAVCTAVHSAMFDSVGQVSLSLMRMHTLRLNLVLK